MWAGTGGEGAKQWLAYLSELKNRGVSDVFIICTDGLKGMGEAIKAIWPAANSRTPSGVVANVPACARCWRARAASRLRR
jgi:predicted acetyltransferase